MRKKQKPAKCLPKNLKQMSSACSISQSLLSSVVNMFQITFSSKKIRIKISTTVQNVRGSSSPRHRLLMSCVRLCLHQAVNLCLYHIELLANWEEVPHLNDISLRTTFVGLCVSLDTFSTTVVTSSQLLLASYIPGLIHFKTFGIFPHTVGHKS